MGVIAIEGIEIYGYHGVYAIERKEGNRFLVDIIMEADILRPMRTDDLVDTVDYHAVYQLVITCMNQPVHLLERLVGKIGQGILKEFVGIEQVKVKVTKIQPISMEKCGQTYVEMTFDRENLIELD